MIVKKFTVNSFVKRYCLALCIATVFCLPAGVQADDLDQKIQIIIEKFEQQIGDATGSQICFLAVRSFFDEVTRKPSLRSAEIRDQIFDRISEKYKGKSKIAILNWRSEKPLEKEVTSPADEISYKPGMLEKQLLKDFTNGFLIAGTTQIAAETTVINIELIHVQSGKVLMRAGAVMPLGAEEAMLAQKTSASEQIPETALSRQTDAKEVVTVPQKEHSQRTVGEGVVFDDKKQAAQKPATVEAAAAEQAAPSDIKAVPEAAPEDLEYKVIEGGNFKYEGHIKDGQKHGPGTLSFTNGDKYEGQWRNDKKHGQGTYTFADGDKYVGQWQHDKMHGQGTYFFKSGNKYVGQWQNDKKHGRGVYHFKNGDIWEGTYVNDKKHGYSVYTWASGGSTKEYWQDGKLVE